MADFTVRGEIVIDDQASAELKAMAEKVRELEQEAQRAASAYDRLRNADAGLDARLENLQEEAIPVWRTMLAAQKKIKDTEHGIEVETQNLGSDFQSRREFAQIALPRYERNLEKYKAIAKQAEEDYTRMAEEINRVRSEIIAIQKQRLEAERKARQKEAAVRKAREDLSAKEFEILKARWAEEDRRRIESLRRRRRGTDDPASDDATQDIDLGDVAGDVGGLAGSLGRIGRLGSAIGKITPYVGVAVTALTAVKMVWDQVEQAFIRTEERAYRTERVISKFGESAYRDLESSLSGIASSDTLTSMLNSMDLENATANLERFGEVAKVVQNAAPHLGMSWEQAMAQAVTSIERGDGAFLEQAGLIENSKWALIEYARSIGVTVQELDTYQRSLALANAIAEENRDILEGDIELTPLENYRQKQEEVKTLLEETRIAAEDWVASIVAPEFENSLDARSAALERFLGLLEDVRDGMDDAAQGRRLAAQAEDEADKEALKELVGKRQGAAYDRTVTDLVLGMWERMGIGGDQVVEAREENDQRTQQLIEDLDQVMAAAQERIEQGMSLEGIPGLEELLADLTPQEYGAQKIQSYIESLPEKLASAFREVLTNVGGEDLYRLFFGAGQGTQADAPPIPQGKFGGIIAPEDIAALNVAIDLMSKPQVGGTLGAFGGVIAPEDVAALNDAINLMGGVLSAQAGAPEKVEATLSPADMAALDEAAQRLANASTVLADASEKFQGEMSATDAAALDEAAQRLANASTVLADASEKFDGVLSPDDLSVLEDAVSQMADASVSLTDASEKFQGVLEPADISALDDAVKLMSGSSSAKVGAQESLVGSLASDDAAILEEAIQRMANATDVLTTSARQAVDSVDIDALNDAYRQLADSSETLTEAQNAVVESTERSGQVAVDASSSIYQLVDAGNDSVDASQKAAEAASIYSLSADEMLNISERMAQSYPATAAAIAMAAEEMGNSASESENLASVYDELLSTQDETADSTARLIDAQTGLPIAFQTAGMGAKELNEQLANLIIQIGSVEAGAVSMARSMAQRVAPQLGIVGSIQLGQQYEAQARALSGMFQAGNEQRMAAGESPLDPRVLDTGMSLLRQRWSAETQQMIADTSQAAISSIDKIDQALDSMIQGVLKDSTKGLIPLEDMLGREDTVDEKARRMADVAVKGFQSPWYESLKDLFPEDVLAEGEEAVKKSAAQMVRDHQKGLTTVLYDTDKAAQEVVDRLIAKQNQGELIDEIREKVKELGMEVSDLDIAEALGIDESVVGGASAKAQDALDKLPTAEDIAQQMSDLFSGEGIEVPDIFGEMTTITDDQKETMEGAGTTAAEIVGDSMVKQATDGAYGERMIKSIQDEVAASEEDLSDSGRKLADWLGTSMLDEFGETVPPGLLDILTVNLVPLIQAAMDKEKDRV